LYDDVIVGIQVGTINGCPQTAKVICTKPFIVEQCLVLTKNFSWIFTEAIWLLNHAQICSWNQSVLANEGKYFYSMKQRGPSSTAVGDEMHELWKLIYYKSTFDWGSGTPYYNINKFLSPSI